MTNTVYGLETLRVDPDSLAAIFITRNGTKIHCRLIQPEDTALLSDFFSRLSPESRRRRFNTSLENIEPERVTEEAHRLAAVDNRTVGGAILAFADGAQASELIAVARLGRFSNAPASADAEAALVVLDDFQGQGVGTALMALLALLARRMGVEMLTASVQADNEALFALLRRLQLPLQRHTTHGETTISIAVDDLPAPKTQT